MPSLADEINSVPAPVLEALRAHAFDDALFARLSAELAAGRADALREKNRVKGQVEPPASSDLVESWDTDGNRALGAGALARGEVAMCVLAGGMATRMGGVVKSLVEVFDGHTFLDLRLRENAALSKKYGATVPLWLMTSDATEAPTRAALAKAHAPDHVRTFVQNLGVRLEKNGALFRDEAGAPSTYATGHGDLVDAMRRSGLLGDFVKRGGKTVFIANLDNLGACLDPALLGAFLRSEREVMVEVCAKAVGDKGGIPVRVDGHIQVLEEFRLPATFDPTRVHVFNTNTFTVAADALLTRPIDWSWFYVEKKVGDRTAVQFERLIQEITSAMTSLYAVVPRDSGGERTSRFLPVKDNAELDARRGALRDLAEQRGWLK